MLYYNQLFTIFLPDFISLDVRQHKKGGDFCGWQKSTSYDHVSFTRDWWFKLVVSWIIQLGRRYALWGHGRYDFARYLRSRWFVRNLRFGNA